MALWLLGGSFWEQPLRGVPLIAIEQSCSCSFNHCDKAVASQAEFAILH